MLINYIAGSKKFQEKFSNLIQKNYKFYIVFINMNKNE